MTLTDTLDHLLSVFLRPLRSWIEREVVAPLRAAYDAAMQTKEQYRDGVYLHLRERLEGTDEHPLAEGVPVRPLPQVQDLAHLQEAVELLADRKIEDASPDIPDGVSLVRLLCDSSLASQVTEIKDTNKGYVFDKPINCYEPIYPNLTRIVIGAIRNTKPFFYVYGYNTGLTQMPYLTTIEFPNLEVAQQLIDPAAGTSGSYHSGFANVDTLLLPKLREIERTNTSNFYRAFIGRSLPSLTKLSAPSLQTMNDYFFGGSTLTNLRELHLPMLKECNVGFCGMYYGSDGCPNLILFEIGAMSTNFDIRFWSPSMALRTDTTEPTYIDLREDKDEQGEFINATNLEQFLANFRKYIIIRLANRTGQTALTLTLSAAVYQNIYGLDTSNNTDNNSWARTHTLADLGLTADDLTEAETAASITINTIYATWLDTYRSAINWNIGH